MICGKQLTDEGDVCMQTYGHKGTPHLTYDGTCQTCLNKGWVSMGPRVKGMERCPNCNPTGRNVPRHMVWGDPAMRDMQLVREDQEQHRKEQA